jgi:hypothetical protein
MVSKGDADIVKLLLGDARRSKHFRGRAPARWRKLGVAVILLLLAAMLYVILTT